MKCLQPRKPMPDQLKTMNIIQNEGKSPEVKFKRLLGAQFGIQAGRIFWPIILMHSYIPSSSLLSIFIKNTITNGHHHHHRHDQHYLLRTQVVCWLGSPEWSPTRPPPQFSSRETSSPMSTTGRCSVHLS